MLDKEKIIELRKQGYSIDDIADEIHASKSGIFRINHINGDGHIERETKSQGKIMRDIANGKSDKSKYNVLCKVCNAKHYVSEILGIKGHEVKWNKK